MLALPAQIFGIGDNPASDIRGANRAGPPWVSVLVRTGVFRGGANSASDPAQVGLSACRQHASYCCDSPKVLVRTRVFSDGANSASDPAQEGLWACRQHASREQKEIPAAGMHWPFLQQL